MPSAADGNPRTKFGDVEFPGEMMHLHLVGRYHIHEYAHTPGGAVEKLGRGLYHCTIRASFQATLSQYPGLYPNGMNKLRGYCELQATLPFTHPTAGQYPAFIIDWNQEKSAKIISGEMVDLDFLEDRTDESFALAAFAVASNSTAIGITSAQLAAMLAKVKADLQMTQTDVGIFDALQNSVNVVLGFRDTAQLYANRYGASVSAMLRLASQFDAAPSMQDARAWPVIDILRQLQGQGIQIRKDLHAKNKTLRKYVVKAAMPITQIAMNIYNGDASQQGALMSLNGSVINNPMSVPAGTSLLYYPPTPQQMAAQGST